VDHFVDGGSHVGDDDVLMLTLFIFIDVLLSIGELIISDWLVQSLACDARVN